MEDSNVISLRGARGRTGKGDGARSIGIRAGCEILAFARHGAITKSKKVRTKRPRLPLTDVRERLVFSPVGYGPLGDTEEAHQLAVFREAEQGLHDSLSQFHGSKSIAMNFDESITLNPPEFYSLNMETMADRLNEAIRARGTSAAALITALRMSKGVVYNILSGFTKPDKLRAATAEAIARELNINVSWLLTGRGPMDRQSPVTPPVSNGDATMQHIPRSAFKRIPVVGTASLGMDGYWTDLDYPAGQGDGYFEFPTKDPDAYVLQVRGGSMHPAIRSGWYVVIEPNKQIQMGEFVMVKLVDGRSTVKEFLWHRDGEYVLNAVATNDRLVVDESDVAAIHHVGGIVPPSGRQP